MTPPGTRGVLDDAPSIYFLDATIASAFVARWCTGARNAGSITAALRAFDGSHGHRRAGGLVRAELERVLCAVVVEGSAGDRARAGIDMVLAPGTRG